jgi:hypothetical protein
VSALGETSVCGKCGAVYRTSSGHACASTRRLILSDGYVRQQVRHLQAEFWRPAGRHARPGSGWPR